MKMAKASPEDLDMAMDLVNVLEDIERGFFPTKLQSDEDAESERVEWIDTADRQQYERLFLGLKSLLNKGSIYRVIWGMAVVCDPANECIDPDADTIEHHPKRQQLEQQVTELIAERDAAMNTDDTRTKQQRELDGSMEVGQLLADSENSTASNSAFKGTEHLTWVHTGNGYISDSSGRFIGAFSGDFRNRDRFICAVNSENQLRQQNAELTAQRDALLAFAASYIAAWNNGSTGDSDIFFMAESAIANCKEPGK